MYEWDEAKRRLNRAKHGVDFAEIESFDWRTADIEPDIRHEYGEVRLIARGLIGSRVHVIIYGWRKNKIRLIGMRKANQREVLKWVAKR